ncbi:MAG: hypothetical protein CO032_06255 [Nitrosopumilales archaeon CG_4_9_14_0_2_um_filter_34_16]|nr:MAG: hypothetical protein CO032_06255 [Nitrosopumilales archaeon CG_4_9_14_0_2_um_filter_34_16]
MDFEVIEKILEVKDEFRSFDDYIWGLVNNKTKVNKFRNWNQIPASTKQSELMSKDLKMRGFTFVGPTICYAFMQTVGMVNDHVVSCFRHEV